jgi:membrane dipeptidase
MFHVAFLKREGPRDVTMVIDHLEHVIDVVGEDFAAIGSDYDGAITPPRDLRSGESYPLLVAEMLSRGWSTGRIEKVLGGNFLRAFRELRP